MHDARRTDQRPNDPACVHQLFEARAARTPDAVALRHRGEAVTCADLNARANRLARHLVRHGVRHGDRVGLRLERSPECVAAMLAVLKTGAAYVPLESALPRARLDHMMAETRPAAVITADRPWTADGVPCLVLAREAAAIAAADGHDLGLPVSPDDAMYIPYTSGSTGLPKGTVVPHRAIPGFFAGTAYARWGEGSTALMHSALSWDGHVLDLYPALLTGGTVVIAPVEVQDPVEVARLCRSEGVATLWLSAQAFNTVVDVDVTLLSGLRSLMVGGEQLSVPHIARALKALPDIALVNGYGPSECTVFAAVHPVTAADTAPEATAIPIGRPIGDRRVLLVDRAGALVDGEGEGEVCVAGPSVPHGYLDRPALTAERFVPDPSGGRPGARVYRTGDRARRRADGVLEFVGREDGQVKLRGFRIELAEIEAVLRTAPGVVDAAAAVDSAGPAPRLAGYVVPAAPGGPVPGGVLEHLRERLHPSMVPAVLMALERLPLGRTGKLDRAALPVPPAPGPSDAAGPEPATATERRLAGIWGEVLGRPAIRTGDDFFTLGGDSLLATRVVARVRSWTGTTVTVRDLYDAPSLRRFAAWLDALDTADRAPAPPPLRRAARRTATTPPSTTRGPAAQS